VLRDFEAGGSPSRDITESEAEAAPLAGINGSPLRRESTGYLWIEVLLSE
jgi:hypothetical protein